jgi:hypothetical protein
MLTQTTCTSGSGSDILPCRGDCLPGLPDRCRSKKLVQNDPAHFARYRTLDEVAATVAHDRNQPLVAIMSNLRPLVHNQEHGPGEWGCRFVARLSKPIAAACGRPPNLPHGTAFRFVLPQATGQHRTKG